jgi:murein peptide amidase A
VHPVKASAVTSVSALLEQLRSAAAAKGFKVEQYGQAASHPLLALTKRTAGVRPKIYVSAGCHGDEPAGPLALLRLLESGYFDARAFWFICPILNPTGLAAGTRENSDGVDLNRDYLKPSSPEIRAHVKWLQRQPRFDLAMCLHEDWESSGYYIYELNPQRRASLAEPIVKAVSAVCPIELAELIDGRPGKDGIIRPIDDPHLRFPWPEAIYLRAHHTDLCYTTESPSARPLEVRIAAQCISIETAVDAVCGLSTISAGS